MWEINRQESREMMAVWPDIVRDITDVIKDLNLPDFAKRMEKVLDYNVPRGKKIRGLILIYTYKTMAPNGQLTEENLRLARILAWCVELIQAYFLVTDDVQDQSMLRRGQPCWYRYNDIGLGAINDGILLQCFTYCLIEKYFKEKDIYTELLVTFQDASFKTSLGQGLDMISTNFGKKPNLDLFTMDQYNSIVKHKASYYTFILPVTAAMHLAGIKDAEMYRQAKTIMFELGHLFQVQDDYLTCFGNTEVCGKDNTDIEEGKCTWLVVVALQRATPKQRNILEECYGTSDPEKVQRVRQLFIDLDLPNTYSIYEEKTCNLINVHVQQISCSLLQSFFLKLLGILYHRMS